MFRVGDCPNDYIRNRVGVLDLRLMMGNTAVHSDMLMWHTEEKPEIAALQIISILFGVMQYSARLENMSDDMKKMSRFWLNFMDDHRELLLNSELTAYEPHLLYTWAKSSSESECMVCTYSVDKCVKPDCKAVVYAANGSEADRVLLDLEECYVAEVYDCYGEVICSGLELKAGIAVVNVPVGGLAVMRRK